MNRYLIDATQGLAIVAPGQLPPGSEFMGTAQDIAFPTTLGAPAEAAIGELCDIGERFILYLTEDVLIECVPHRSGKWRIFIRARLLKEAKRDTPVEAHHLAEVIRTYLQTQVSGYEASGQIVLSN